MNFFQYQKNKYGTHDFDFYVGDNEDNAQKYIGTVFSPYSAEEAADLLSDLNVDFASGTKDGVPVLSTEEYSEFQKLTSAIDYRNFLIEVYEEAYGKDFNFDPVYNAVSMIDEVHEETEQIWCELNRAFDMQLEKVGGAPEAIISKEEYDRIMFNRAFQYTFRALKFYYAHWLKRGA